MGFWPTGPFTTLSMVVIFVTATAFFIWGRREQRFIAAALLISWIGARLYTSTDNMLTYIVFLTVAAGCALTPFTVISRYIGLIYGLRIVILLLVISNITTTFWLWELNRVLLWVQILLAWGTIASGPGRPSPDGDHSSSALGRWWPYHVFGALRSQEPHLHQADQTSKEQGH